jgi:hypothetical protein
MQSRACIFLTPTVVRGTFPCVLTRPISLALFAPIPRRYAAVNWPDHLASWSASTVSSPLPSLHRKGGRRLKAVSSSG